MDRGLSRSPGPWRWEDRGDRGWWRVNDQLLIEDGPHKAPLQGQSNSERWAAFTYREMTWIVLGLAWARSFCAERDDPVLIRLFEDSGAALPLSRGSGDA